MTDTQSAGHLINRVVRNFFWGFIAEIANKGSIFVAFLLLANALGTAQFGTFSFFYAIFTFLWIGVDLGTGMYGTREVARRDHDAGALLSTVLSMRLFLAVIISIVTIIGAYIFAHDVAVLSLLFGFAIYLILRSANLDWYLRGFERFRELAVVGLFVALALLSTAWWLVRTPEDLAFASAPWAIGFLVGMILLALFAYRVTHTRIVVQFSPSTWLEHWNESVHFTLANGLSTLYQNLALFYLYLYSSPAITGTYSAAFRITLAFIFVISILPMTIYPTMASLYRTDRHQFRILVWSSLGGITLIVIPLAGVLWLVADKVIIWLVGVDYSNAIPVLKILTIFMALRAIRAIFVRAVCSAGFQRRYSFVSVLANVLLLVGLIVLPVALNDPLRGVAVAMVVVETIVVLMMAGLTMQIAYKP